MARIKAILLAVALAAAGAVAPPSLRGQEEAAASGAGDTFDRSIKVLSLKLAPSETCFV